MRDLIVGLVSAWIGAALGYLAGALCADAGRCSRAEEERERRVAALRTSGELAATQLREHEEREATALPEHLKAKTS